MHKKILASTIVIALSLTACTMEYKRIGGDFVGSAVGYSDFEIGKNKYKITYTGQKGSTVNEVMQFAYRRGRELCKERGFNDYIFTNPDIASNDSGVYETGLGYNPYVDPRRPNVYILDVECKNTE